MKKIIYTSLMLVVTGCAQDLQTASNNSSPNMGLALTPETESTTTESTSEEIVAAAAATSSGGFSICSKLDMSSIDWPTAVATTERQPLALALNISGSFEGNVGWVNLTNNFDGQGMSLGLLNQCLGQGSLQPLLISMRDNYPDTLDADFSSANLKSLLNMLSNYEGQAKSMASVKLNNYGLSDLDDPDEVARITGQQAPQVQSLAVSKASQSVSWAVANLYSGSSFKSAWKTSFTAMANSAGYRSIQVDAASGLHTEALSYVKKFGLKQVRSYLFFFDIVVQNGGLPAEDVTTIQAAMKKNPKWTETQILNEILAVRIKHVKSAYQADVKSRKLSLINGTGVVHGASRNYAKEYCTSINVALP